MPKNTRYTNNEAIDAVADKLKQNAGNVQVTFDQATRAITLVAPAGETLQTLSLDGTSLKIVTSSSTKSVDLATILGDKVTNLSLDGTTLNINTNQGTKSIDLATLRTPFTLTPATTTTLGGIKIAPNSGLDITAAGELSAQNTRVLDMQLFNKQLTLQTAVGDFTVDLAPVIPTLPSIPVAIQSLTATGGTYLMATMTDGSEAEIDLARVSDYILSECQNTYFINQFERVGNTIYLQTNASGTKSIDLSDLVNSGGSGTATTDASLLTSGTLADARLSSNVPLLNTNNTYTGLMTVRNDILMRGVGDYAYQGATATVYFGDTNHGFRGTAGKGVSLLTWRTNNPFNLRQVTGQVGFGVGFDEFEESAQVQVNSTTRGSLLTPRMTQAQRQAISVPAQGLQVFQTDGDEGVYIYTYATGWTKLGVAATTTTPAGDYLTDIQISKDGTSLLFERYVNGQYVSNTTIEIGKQVKREWYVGGYYEAEDIVFYQGKMYSSLLYQTASSVSDAPSLNTSNWQLLDLSGYASTGGGGNYDDTALQNRVATVESTVANKVDKVAGKQLSTEDFTSANKSKLDSLKILSEGPGISISVDGVVSATGGGSGTGYDDTALKNRVTTVENTVVNKVDKVNGKQLSTEDFTSAEKTKLAGLQNTPAYDDSQLATRVTTVENTVVNKVDKVSGKQLTDVNFSQADKTKLDSLQNTGGGSSYDDTALKNRVTAVENGKLSNAPKSVTGAHIADDTISTNNFTDHCITEIQMAANAIGATELKDNSVTGAKLTSNSVSTAKLQDQAITTAKIANDTVQWYQLARWAVVEDKIKDDNVTEIKLSPELRAKINATNSTATQRQVEFNFSPGSSVIELVAGPNQVAFYSSLQFQNVSNVHIQHYASNGLTTLYNGAPSFVPGLTIELNMRLIITITQNNTGGFSFLNFQS